MESVVTAVETAITSAETHVEAEAFKLAEDLKNISTRFVEHVQGTVHASIEAVLHEAATIKNSAELNRLKQELEGVLAVIPHPAASPLIDPAITQAKKEEAEDVVAVRGIASRLFHRLVEFI